MSNESALELIREIIAEIALAKGQAPIAVTPTHHLLDGSLGIDSLDLAALVVRLQQKTGSDPFADGFIDFHTVGELASLFTRARP